MSTGKNSHHVEQNEDTLCISFLGAARLASSQATPTLGTRPANPPAGCAACLHMRIARAYAHARARVLHAATCTVSTL